MEKLIITPKTKVFELLLAYPELEALLIEMAPVFKKLQNPVLRRTIARVTTLQQAAQVGEIPDYRTGWTPSRRCAHRHQGASNRRYL